VQVFGVYVGFEDNHKSFVAMAQTDCLLFVWKVDDLEAMAARCSPALSHDWRNMVAAQLGIEFDWRQTKAASFRMVRPKDASGQLEGYEIAKGGSVVVVVVGTC
jgi:hypothetical protein